MMTRAKCIALATAAFCSAACLFGADNAPAPVALFNGENLDGWMLKRSDGSHWKVGLATVSLDDEKALHVAEAPRGKGELINAQGGGVDIYSEQEFGDGTIELEVMVPKGSNSGIYVQGNYEIQVLDSFGKKQVGPGDIGGLYGAAAPAKDAAKAPGEWQKFVIEFQAPGFAGGKKTSNAVFKKVTLNGVVIHENVELAGPTPGNLGGGEKPAGPIMFQGDHGPVAYRNILVRPAAK